MPRRRPGARPAPWPNSAFRGPRQRSRYGPRVPRCPRPWTGPTVESDRAPSSCCDPVLDRRCAGLRARRPRPARDAAVRRVLVARKPGVMDPVALTSRARARGDRSGTLRGGRGPHALDLPGLGRVGGRSFDRDRRPRPRIARAGARATRSIEERAGRATRSSCFGRARRRAAAPRPGRGAAPRRRSDAELERLSK